ncbi:MAG: SdrD B-like domain-containing protein, partial [Paracoccaceae bacterium]
MTKRRFVKSAFLVLSAAVTVSLASAQTASAHDWLVDGIQGPSFMPAGGIASYVVGVRNTGAATSPTSTLFAEVPAGTTYIPSDTPPSSSCSLVGNTVECPLPELAEDEFVAFTLDFLTVDQGVLTFTASVPSDDGDTDPDNNSEFITTTINRGADLQLEIEAPVDVVSGGGIDYALRVTNAGPHAADNFTVNFPAPVGVAHLVAPANCTLVAGTYSCEISEPLAPDEDITLNFSGQAAAAANSTITVQASITGQSPADPFSDNDVVEVSTEVNAGSDLAISKTRTPGGTILQGSQVVFTLAGSYTGEAPGGQITITYVLPAAYTYVSHNAPAEWTCDFASGTLTCTRPAPDTGAGADISLGAIALHVTASDTGTPTNTADITAANTEDPNPANNSASVDATIEAPFIDLAASKSGPRPALVVVGQEFDFTLGARNLGNAGFIGTVRMTDRVPAGMTISAAAGEAWQCGPLPVSGPADLVCDIVYTAENPLPAQGATPALTLTATSGNEGPMRNSAQVSGIGGNYPDENLVNDTATYNVDVSVDQDSADVSVEKAALRPSLPAGEEQTFQITVRNAGPDIAQNVEVTDLLTDLINTDTGPDNGLVSAVWSTPVPGGGTPPINTTPEGGGLMLRSTIPALPVCNADCPVLTVTITVGGDGGTRTNTVDAVSQTTADPNWPNGTATATYDVESRVDVTLTKTATPDPVAVGQPLSFVLTATNEGNGLSRAHDVTVTDTLPHGLMFLSAEPSTGSCSVTPAAGSETGPGNDQLVCNLSNLNNGAQQTVKIQTRPMLVLNGETVTNTATVTTTTTELDETNNDAEVTVTVAPPLYDLIVAKIDTEDPVTVGEDTIYVITITNNGPSAAENVVMTDTLPATLLSFQEHTYPSDAACGTVPQTGDYGGELICTIPYMSSGSSREFTVTMRGEAKGSVTNVVSVTADGPQWEINQGNNTASQNTTVRTRVDLEVVSKTAEPGTVPLREHFEWKIFLRNNVNEAHMLAEADDVVFTDNLPAGMVLTEPPRAEATVGSITRNVCTGEEGDTSISCEFGTMSKGAEVYVTLPVMVTDITTDGQEFINGADIATSSYDRVTSNNTNTGKVTITAGSISGSVWRDFNADGSRDEHDSGLDSITLTLNGTDLHRVAFTRTTQTAADGNYTFGLLPEGDYTITRTGPTPEHHEDLAALPGPNGGTASGATVIANISLDAEADVTDYDFTLRPIARLGLAKAASEPALQADGSFTFTFQIHAQNYSLEPLNDITITDSMSGALPGFGSYNPDATNLLPGEYHASAAPACGTVNSGFNGASDTVLISGLSLGVNNGCTVNVAMTVRPEIPLPYTADDARRYINQATITGEGMWSGQTSPGNENLNNLSHNGNNPDPNNNGMPGEQDERTPTPVGITYDPSIAVVKEITDTSLSTPVVAGDTVTYSFTVTNTGNVPLTDVVLDDPKLPGAFDDVTIAQLMPGASDSTTFGPITYSLTADDVAAGEVVNQATATGTWGLDGSGNPETVDDVSGATVDDDEPTILTMGDISLVKTANTADFSDPVMAGDVLRWSFTVTNNGSATLQNVLVSDTIDGVDVTGAAITLAPGESDSTNFTAEYTLTQEDIDAGSFTNAASVIGYYGEDGGDHYPVTDDDSVTTPLPAEPEISLIKAADDIALTDPAVLGQEISYSFTIENIGNVTLSDITLADLLDGIEFNDGEIATLAPGDIDSDAFSATYAITQADIDRGFVTNEATVTGNFTDAGGTLHQPQDTDDTRTEVAQDAQIRLVKLSQTSLTAPVEIGDEIEYAFEISNIGNVTLTNIRITDNIATVTGGPITLAPEATDELTFTAVYAITAEDIEAGFVDNTATVFGDYTDGSGTTQTVDDISGTDVDNDTPTTVTIPQSPAIALIKRADVSGLSSPPAVDDLVRYTFEVVNTGNVTLTGIEIEDLLPGIDVSGGPLASLAPGGVDTETFEASYPLTQEDLDRGYVENTATV